MNDSNFVVPPDRSLVLLNTKAIQPLHAHFRSFDTIEPGAFAWVGQSDKDLSSCAGTAGTIPKHILLI